MNPTYDFFGGSPVTIVFQTSGSFDGNAIADVSTAVITSGVVAFPAQQNSRIDFHKRPIVINSISATFGSGGTGKASIVMPGGSEVVIATLSDGATVNPKAVVPAGAYLKLTSTGGAGTKVLAVSAQEVVPGANAL